MSSKWNWQWAEPNVYEELANTLKPEYRPQKITDLISNQESVDEDEDKEFKNSIDRLWKRECEKGINVIEQNNCIKPDMTLIPPNALYELGVLLTKGLKKHPDEPWRNMSVREHLAAAMRHQLAYLKGEWNDEEDCSHLVNAAARLLFAIELSHGKS